MLKSYYRLYCRCLQEREHFKYRIPFDYFVNKIRKRLNKIVKYDEIIREIITIKVMQIKNLLLCGYML